MMMMINPDLYHQPKKVNVLMTLKTGIILLLLDGSSGSPTRKVSLTSEVRGNDPMKSASIEVVQRSG